MDPVELTDGTVVLRTMSLDDVDDITEACQDPETQRWTTVPVPYKRDALGRLRQQPRRRLGRAGSRVATRCGSSAWPTTDGTAARST